MPGVQLGPGDGSGGQPIREFALKTYPKFNYAAANKADNGHTTWRRQLAAGVIMAGGIVTNISRAERRKVYAAIPGSNGCQLCAPRPSASSSKVPAAPDPGTKGCTGRRDKTYQFKTLRPLIAVNWVDADLHFNSCETDLMIRNLNYDAIAFGIVAAICGLSVVAAGYGVALAVVGGLLAIGANEIEHRQNRSSKDAVWFDVRHFGYYISLRSQ